MRPHSPPPIEARKTPSPPLARLEKAVSNRHVSAFQRALDELNTSAQVGQWQHRVLRLLLDMPSTTPEQRAQQLDWLGRLFTGQHPPQPTASEKFMELALADGAFHVLPALHAAGFCLEDTPQSRSKVARMVAEGQWPHPELLFPRLMECPDARADFCFALGSSLLRPDGKGFLVASHVEKFCALHIPQRVSLRKKIHDAFHRFALGNAPTRPSDCATVALAQLHRANLVDLLKLARQHDRNACMLSLLAPALAQLQCDELHEKSDPVCLPPRVSRI